MILGSIAASTTDIYSMNDPQVESLGRSPALKNFTNIGYLFF